MPRSQIGSANPSTTLNDALVRKIRLLSICDGLSSSQIAREYCLNVSCISRIVNWNSWKHTDEDLKELPRIRHKNGYSRSLTNEEKKQSWTGISCRQCLHLTKDGCCGLEFPECIKSAYKEAKNCNAFILKNA